ncbi:MAG: SusC/RagA family TonB-linked outer membrane protein, partial [Prevotellaceae bacterium]|nr:SusC/RagA family TonB-linked outer membrane protein [Prevotellaceae bacterium]
MKRITTRVKILHLVILAALLAIAMASHAQSTQVNIQVKDVMVKEILKMIEAQSEYRFFYSDDLTYINKKITLNAVSRTIKSVLDEVLRSSDLTYKIEENNLIILVPIQQMQKDNSVTGTITDTGGEPVIGATIVVKGAKTATISDINGKYKITIPNEKAILSYILFGYTTQDVTVGERREINVVLSEEIRRLDLDEVVVVGYGIQNKKTMTGSVSVVNTVDLETSAKSTVSQALQGKAAGLRVQQQSAQAGGGADFKIRGAASPNAGNEPLFIVDGIPISKATDVASFNIYGAGKTDSYLESINPDDIESITVLKDAASTAIYGARAGHGVILITTKRGNKNQNNITYSGNVTVQTIAKNYEMLNAQRYMEVMNKYNYESWLYTSQANVPENIYLGYNRPSTSGAYPGHNFSDQDIANATMTDWVGAVMRTAVLHQHNISLSGGSESLRYLLSGNYMNQEGIIKNNNASRFTIRANVDKDLSKYFSIGLSASYAQNRYDNSAVGEDDDYEKAGILRAAAQFNPTLPIRDADGVYTIDPARATSPNPVSLLEIIDNTVKDRVIGSAYLTVKPITGLELKLQLGGDRMIQKRSNYLPTTTREGMQYNGQGSIVDMD